MKMVKMLIQVQPLSQEGRRGTLHHDFPPFKEMQ